MTCKKTKTLMSPYLDGRVTGTQMQSVAQHLSHCAECNREFSALRGTQHLVAGLGRKQAPPELQLRIRLALSREAAHSPRRRFEALRDELEHTLNSFAVPATAGVVSAVVFFGLLMGFFALPEQLEASNDAVPTLLYTPPVLDSSPFALSTGTGSLMVEAVVDTNGRVQDYRIISAPSAETREVLPQLKNMLIFTVFRPATAFGKPTTGRVVLSFSKINVKG
jgi:hypothetical protein